jgi:FkbM family methyltransferase
MLNIKKWPFKLKRSWYLNWSLPTIKISTLKLGSPYGSWVVPNGLLNNESICYLAGAGEDISFDLALQQRFGCDVHIFDPTPRAIQHFEMLTANIKEGKAFSTPTGYSYPIEKPDRAKLTFHPLGLWDNEETLKFFAPKNQEHVSFSALNLQQTTDYFEAKADSVRNIMQKQGHQHLTLLKLDIEGSEYRVIDSVVADKLPIDLICIEFDESHTPLDNQFHTRIKQAINKLKTAGYQIYDIDSTYNISMISQQALAKLKSQNH